MNYYKCIFYRGDSPQGKAYTFRSESEYKHGDTVEVYGHRKAMVSGTLKEEEVEYDLLAIKPIIGIWKGDDEEKEE